MGIKGGFGAYVLVSTVKFNIMNADVYGFIKKGAFAWALNIWLKEIFYWQKVPYKKFLTISTQRTAVFFLFFFYWVSF